MDRTVKCGLIQAGCPLSGEEDINKIKKAMIEKHVKMIEDAGQKGVQVLCLQELFYGPYFPAEQNPKWYDLKEKVPEGPTVSMMQGFAKKYNMVMVVSVCE
ncbi:MAG: hypothetical protein JSV50_12565, partial [Desulfobacteraceae bacterium]